MNTRTDWDAEFYWPSPNTPLLECHALIKDPAGNYHRCAARYLDDPPSRDAHKQVFGHPPVSDPQ